MHIRRKKNCRRVRKREQFWPSSIKINQKFFENIVMWLPQIYHWTLMLILVDNRPNRNWKIFCVFFSDFKLFRFFKLCNTSNDKNLISSHHHPKGNKWIFIVEEPEKLRNEIQVITGRKTSFFTRILFLWRRWMGFFRNWLYFGNIQIPFR